MSAESEPPTTMTEVSASKVEIQEDSVQFDLMWSPPSTANGVLTEYELALGTTATELLPHSTYPVSI